MDFVNQLNQLGFLPTTGIDGTEQIITSEAVKAAIWDYQVFHGLVPDGVPGPVFQAHLAQPRCCNHPDIMPMTAKEYAKSKRWPTDHITYGFENLGEWPFQAGETKDIFGWALDQWGRVTRLTFEHVTDKRKALIWIQYRRIDGPGQVLAWMQLPGGGMHQRLMRVDAGDTWGFAANPRGFIDAGAVIAHELGHAWGMLHIGGNGNALLNPVYRPGLRTPQAPDIASMRQLGYPAPSTNPPTGGGGGDATPQTATIQFEGAITGLSVPGWTATRKAG